MAYLLDTHTFYWIMIDSPSLRPAHRQLLIETAEPVYVSAVSGWEIGTKVRLGKWPEAAPMLPGLEQLMAQAGLEQLPLTIAQAERAGGLVVEHKDPFDRLLAAQALDRDLTLLSVDPAMRLFGCKVI